MLKGLFKSGWKSDSVDKRLRFIADIDVSVSAIQTILEKLAANDVDTGVRHAAMAKMSNPQALYDLWQSHESSVNTDSIDNIESRQFAETPLRN